MDYKAYTLVSILLASLTSVVPIGISYAQTEGAATANTTGAATANTTEEANVPAINATGGGQWTTFDLTVRGQKIPLQYRIDGGSVEKMAVYDENKTLGITIKSMDDGTLALRLPRDIIDSKTVGGTDADFAAFIDNSEYEQPGEIEPAAATRTLLIGFPAGAAAIDVIGTTTGTATAGGGTNATTGAAGTNATTGAAGTNATTGAAGTNATIPEFSTIAVVVLAIAIIGIIIATARQGRFSFGQRM